MTAIRVARVAHTPHIVAATLGTIARIFKIGSRRRGSLNAWSGNAGRVTEKTKGVFQTMENMSLKELAAAVHENAVAHGWWEEERGLPEVLMLCVSELAEALEEYRNGQDVKKVYFHFDACGDMTRAECAGCYNGNPKCRLAKPEGVAVELADCVIRILDYCGHAGIDLEEAIRIKHEYNKSRPYRHGGKKC